MFQNGVKSSKRNRNTYFATLGLRYNSLLQKFSPCQVTLIEAELVAIVVEKQIVPWTKIQECGQCQRTNIFPVARCSSVCNKLLLHRKQDFCNSAKTQSKQTKKNTLDNLLGP